MVANFEKTSPGVFEMRFLRTVWIGIPKLLQRFLHWSHFLLALKEMEASSRLTKINKQDNFNTPDTKPSKKHSIISQSLLTQHSTFYCFKAFIFLQANINAFKTQTTETISVGCSSIFTCAKISGSKSILESETVMMSLVVARTGSILAWKCTQHHIMNC